MSSTFAAKKRRRRLLTTGENDMKITDLPDWAIKEVITYIPKTSRALLALALTTDSSSWREVHWDKSAPKSILSWFNNTTITKMMRPSAITKAILSPRNEEEEENNNMWEEINFEDNDISLCWKLNDDDIAGILACTNSVKHLKYLFLPDCMEITGRALEPLRGSSILEQLDVCIAAIANLKWSTARFATDLAVNLACMCWNVSIMIAKKRPVRLVVTLFMRVV